MAIGDELLDANGIAGSSGTAGLAIARFLGGDGAASSTGTAAATLARFLGGAGAGESDGTAGLDRSVGFWPPASGAASSTGTSALTLGEFLDAAGAGGSGGTGGVEAVGSDSLFGSGSGSSTGSGGLDRLTAVDATGAGSSVGLSAVGVARELSALGAAASYGFAPLAVNGEPITIFIPYEDIPCAACCLTPDVLCFRVIGCDGDESIGRLRRIPPTGPTDFRWDTCTAGSVRVLMNCDYTTGRTLVIVSDGRGGGGPLPIKVPDLFCGGYHISWSDPADSMPVFRCGPGDNQTVALVEITDVATGGCAACTDGGGGIEAKTITAEPGEPCPTVCSCCALVPCRQCLVLSINAPGCDFSGMAVVLESPDGGCTWEGTLQPDAQLPAPELNCTGEIAASATCTGGGWAITFGTPDLLGCGSVVTTRAQCDPLVQVLARLVCTGEEEE